MDDLGHAACDVRVVFMVNPGGVCRLMRPGMHFALWDTHRRSFKPVAGMCVRVVRLHGETGGDS